MNSLRGIGAQRGPGPHFICIGTGNSATTWLADHLKLQWDCWMPPVQEASYLKTRLKNVHGVPHLDLKWDWWSTTKRLVRNKSLLPWRDVEYLRTARELAALPGDEPDLDGYIRLFAPALDKITGDVAPIYGGFTVDEIRQRASVLEGRRIFMIARDPVQRFWSAMGRHSRYQTYGDVDYGSLETAKRLFNDPERSKHHFPTKILDRWNEALGEGSVEVFFFDDIVQRPRKTFEDIVRFIGADIHKRLPLVPVSFNRKQGDPRPLVSAEAREWVTAAFQDELKACAERFGERGQAWLERSRSAHLDRGRHPDYGAIRSEVK